MNPIEHVWDALGRRVAGHQPPPQSLQELERGLLEEWDRVPQFVIYNLIDSMPQRISLVTHTIVRVGRYLSQCSCEAVSNSWFLCNQDAISNRIPLKIKMDRLKFKLEIVEALSASPPTNKSILNDYEDSSVEIPLAKRSKRYNLPAIYVMAFILATPG
ncbi:uncharacterized protein TNCV_4801311 [Trichonephila clavipes]|nr:uncharacterized protein TNCV_4801311 [Trichonephila clavipes]